MGGAVGADQAGAVDHEAHRQRLEGNVMHHLIIAALQEGRINRAEGLEAFRRQPRREGHRVLFGDADIEKALRIGLGEKVEAGSRGHGGGDRNDPRVLGGFLDQRVAENLGESGRLGGRLVLRAGGDVEFDHAVILVGRRLGRGIALALFGDDMQQDRPAFIAQPFKHVDQQPDVVTVDRAGVAKPHLLEQNSVTPLTGAPAAGKGRGKLGLDPGKRAQRCGRR